MGVSDADRNRNEGNLAEFCRVVIFYVVGGGLIEELISPIVEACLTTNKSGMMSLLHSLIAEFVLLLVSANSKG